MSFRFECKSSRDDLHLLSEPYLSRLNTRININLLHTLFSKLYFSYNTKTQQTTIITTDLNRSHLWIIQHFKELSGMSVCPVEVGRLLVQHFIVEQECYTATARQWDAMADGPVCCKNTIHIFAHLLFPTGNGITNVGQCYGPPCPCSVC